MSAGPTNDDTLAARPPSVGDDDTLAARPPSAGDDDTLAARPRSIGDADTVAPARAVTGDDDTLAARRPVTGDDDTAVEARHRAVPAATDASGRLVPGTSIGRYLILSRLGAGGMGVVYAAYDPELDRKVAVKLLFSPEWSSEHSSGRHRLIREAQAMAQLNHPNVVTVHDVGEHEGRIYVAMELVAGTTLGGWRRAAPRQWPEIVDMFVHTGRGLVAAHARGLVHRDFKPDNVMVDEEGRPRVMDFGLARSTDAATERHAMEPSPVRTVPKVGALSGALTVQGSVMGTPAYMAPEQHWGGEVGPAADQFAFCVALWEALFGARPFSGSSIAELTQRVTDGVRDPPPTGVEVPGWLRRACDRGLAIEPAMRWPDLSTLLEVLARGRAMARRRKIWAGLGAGVVLATGIAASRFYARAEAIAACENDGASIGEVWDDESRGRLREALLHTGIGHAQATADRVVPMLDAQAEAWTAARTEACLATNVEAREGWTADVLDRAVWCLGEHRLELASLVDELSKAEPHGVDEAVPLVSALPSADTCLDREVLTRLPPPPASDREALDDVRAMLSRAGALEDLGEHEEGLRLARDALTAAETLGWPPLTAAARTRVGSLLAAKADHDAAETMLEEAWFQAAEAGAFDVAVTAADVLTFSLGHGQARHGYAVHWAKLAELHRAMLPDPAGLRAARGLNEQAILREAMGEYDEAQGLYERALALQEAALGPEHFLVAQTLNNLADVHASKGAHARAGELFERALSIKEHALGAGHPSIAMGLNNLARVHWTMGDQARAVELLQRALEIKRETLGAEHAEVASSLTNLALVRQSMGETAVARPLYEEALEIAEKALGPEHPTVATILSNLGHTLVELDDPAGARAMLERSIAIRERALGTEHPKLVDPLVLLARIALEHGDREAASRRAEQAVRIAEAAEVPKDQTAAARFVLARVLWDDVGQQARAYSLAAEARATYAAAGAPHRHALEKVEAWLAARDDPGGADGDRPGGDTPGSDEVRAPM